MTNMLTVALISGCARSRGVELVEHSTVGQLTEFERWLRDAEMPGADVSDPNVDDLGWPLVRPLRAVEHCIDCPFGLMGPQGDWLVSPQFDYAEALYHDGAWVSKSDRWDLIGIDGIAVIKDAVGTFPLGVRDGKPVFLPAGMDTVSVRACEARSGDLVRFVVAKLIGSSDHFLFGADGVLLATGAVVSACADGTFLYALSPSEGASYFPAEEGWHAGTNWWMLNTRTGERSSLMDVAAVHYDRMDELRGEETLPVALESDGPEGNHFFVPNPGRIVGSGAGESCCFGDGIEASLTANGLWQYRDSVTGEVRFNAEIQTPGVFNDGYAAVQLAGDQSWTLLDREGRSVWHGGFDSLVGPSGGLLIGTVGGFSGYLNLRGDWVIPPVFSLANPFSAGAFWTRASLGPSTYLVGKDGRVRALSWHQRLDYIYWPATGPIR